MNDGKIEVTDQMKILIINNAEPEIREFVLNIQQHFNESEVTCTLLEYADCLQTDLSIYDGIVISGSPQGDDIVEHHQPFFQWILNYPKPILGICAGHHITAVLYGGSYLRGLESESGDLPVELLVDDPIFNGLPQQLTVRQMHNDSVTLPDGFIHIAQSSQCLNQGMKHQEKPLYTFQFHPEYLNPKLFENFAAICKQD